MTRSIIGLWSITLKIRVEDNGYSGLVLAKDAFLLYFVAGCLTYTTPYHAGLQTGIYERRRN